ncbi:hydroxymethylglutaryl-CoA lyase [Primorskyibacter sp. S187A]|uniref:hydroxymethylglutaryl-CoA lyase n=1 Tax=Primorskyibacter sp. S187A TaxID=3415130 RepID=UPI003C7C7D49
MAQEEGLMENFVEIFEVGPRDGLQNEEKIIPTSDKIALTDLLSRAGFKRIECASFVSPKWVPQMADSADVMAGIVRAPGVSYAALAPNTKGLERAIDAGASEVAIFGAASEAFAKANINATIDESLARFAPVMARAQEVGMPVRGYVSVAVDCPYSGPVAPSDAARVAAALFDMGCYEISLGDTTGRGRPDQVEQMLQAVVDHVPASALAGHYHDTDGLALENIELSLEHGLRVFDAAVGGLGGCPYSPGAKGNVATERVAALLESRGIEHGLDMKIVNEAAALAQSLRRPST